MIDSGLMEKPAPQSLIKISEEDVALAVDVGVASGALATGLVEEQPAMRKITALATISRIRILRFCPDRVA